MLILLKSFEETSFNSPSGIICIRVFRCVNLSGPPWMRRMKIRRNRDWLPRKTGRLGIYWGGGQGSCQERYYQPFWTHGKCLNESNLKDPYIVLRLYIPARKIKTLRSTKIYFVLFSYPLVRRILLSQAYFLNFFSDKLNENFDSNLWRWLHTVPHKQ